MPAPSFTASAAPNRKPRASIPATRSTGPSTAAAIRSTVSRSPSASSSSVVMSRNMMPGLGKSGIVRMRCRMSSFSAIEALKNRNPAQAVAGAGFDMVGTAAAAGQCLTPAHTER
jgi:hypothetical protein